MTAPPEILRRTFLISAVVSLTIVVTLIAWQAMSALLVIFGALLVSLLLSGLAGWLDQHTPMGYKLTLALCGIVLLTFFGGVFYLLGGTIAEQLASIGESLPAAVDRLNTLVQKWAGQMGIEQVPPLSEAAPTPKTLASSTIDVLGILLGALANIVLMLLLGAFIAASPSTYWCGVVHLVPEVHRSRAQHIMTILARAVRHWLTARLIVMAITFTLTYIGLTIINMPFAVGLSFVAALAAFVPYIGAYLGGAVGVLVALTQDPQLALYALIVYLIIENVQGMTIEPLIEARLTSAPPGVLLAAQIVLGVLLGLPGLIIASPLAVMVMVLVQMLYVQDVLHDPHPALGEHNTRTFDAA